VRRVLLLTLLTPLAPACVAAHLRIPEGAVEALAVQDPDSEPAPVPPAFVEGKAQDEWVRLTSGEWLRGDVEALVGGTLEFDSEQLDGLSLDWDDVAELHTSRPFTVLLENRGRATGRLVLGKQLLRVSGDEGEWTFRRDDVQRIVKGSLRERDHWSGSLRLGFAARRGNTDQTDLSLGAAAKRRTAGTRLVTSLDVLESEQDGSEIADNQRFRANFDVFLTSRLYWTPLALELYSDRFQNIDLRATPSTGLGYTFVDTGKVEWSGAAGIGYRYTRYESVAPGQDREDEETVAIFGTRVDSDLTEKMDLAASYQIQVSLEDSNDTQQDASLVLDYDLWGDLDLTIGFLWSRVGDPEPDSSGNTPEPDDFRLDVGLGWSF
jgi:putative salt-induced outer membrane protein YdiY